MGLHLVPDEDFDESPEEVWEDEEDPEVLDLSDVFEEEEEEEDDEYYTDYEEEY